MENKQIIVKGFEDDLLTLQGSLTKFALYFTPNKDDAKDLVQETMLKALLYRQMYKAGTNLKAWTFTIMRNIYINIYRRGISRPCSSYDRHDFGAVNAVSQMPNAEDNYSTTEIKRMIHLLEDELKVPFVMLTSGYKYEEIAKTTSLKIGTVKSRIFFARKRLMSQLKDYK